MRRPFAFTVAAALFMGSGATLLAGGTFSPASALDTTVPAGTAAAFGLGTTAAKDLQLAGGRLWVSSGPLKAYTTSGGLAGTVTGVSGADSLAAAPDGSHVYAAQSAASSIQEVDATTLAVTNTWTTQPCPRGISATATTVYYAFGCSNTGRGAAALDLSTGVSTDIVAPEVYGPMVTQVAGTTLALQYEYAETRTFSIAGASPVQIGATTGSSMPGTALSADGTRLLAEANTGYGYAVGRYAVTGSPAALQGAVQAEAYPAAVAWSPDGKRFAVAMSQGDDFVGIWDDATGAIVAHSVPPVGPAYHLQVVQGTLTFSPAGDTVYALAHDIISNAYSVVRALTAPGKAARVTLSATSPRAYGQKLHLVATTPGCATCRVRFDVRDAVLGSHSYTRTTTAGTVALDVTVRGNGSATVILLPDLYRVTAQVSRNFVVPAAFTFVPKGTFTVKSGVVHYASTATPKLAVYASPRRSLSYLAKLQVRTSSGWVTVDTGTFTTSDAGSHLLYFTIQRHRTFRVAVRLPSNDGINAASRYYYSKAFVRD